MNESRPSLARVLALNRSVGIVLISVLFFGLGEQLWSQFMPIYLEAQTRQVAREASAGAAVAWQALWAIGSYAFLRNLFEGFCYIGGGQLTARLGDRGSLILFGILTLVGYVLFLTSATPVLTILAALLIIGWEPLSVPVTFTTVGSTVERAGQGMAFALQSIQKRLPKIIGPFAAGLVLGAAEQAVGDPEAGRIHGMQFLVGTALVLGLVTLVIQYLWMPPDATSTIRKPQNVDESGETPNAEADASGAPVDTPAGSVLGSLAIVRQFDLQLRSLLVAEVFTRWCDWLVREFVVLYVVLKRGVSLEMAGALLAVQNLTALATYVPIGQLTRSVGLQPFIGLTFVFFALFPLALALCPGGVWLYLAFVVYGLREIGEPARKALITALLPSALRARGVGLYWGLRSFAICTASLAGAALWHAYGPEVLLYVAFGLGCVGAAVYYRFARRQRPASQGQKETGDVAASPVDRRDSGELGRG